METRRFGQGADALPVVGQGTWYMERDPDAIDAIRRGIDLGLTHVDTAEMYGAGEVETLVGRAIAGRRNDVFLVSKVLPSNASRRGTVAACQRTLERLRTDRLDLYLLHWPGSHPLEETVAGFDDLLRAGKIAAFGVSNFDADELDQFVAVAGPGRVACNQVLYHPGERTIERTLLPRCREHGVPLVAYSPLGHGSLPDAASPGGRAMADVAAARGVSVAQVALRFVLRHPDAFAIPKAGRIAHVEDNAAAGTWRLDAEEVARLESALPEPGRMRGIPML